MKQGIELRGNIGCLLLQHHEACSTLQGLTWASQGTYEIEMPKPDLRSNVFPDYDNGHAELLRSSKRQQYHEAALKDSGNHYLILAETIRPQRRRELTVTKWAYLGVERAIISCLLVFSVRRSKCQCPKPEIRLVRGNTMQHGYIAYRPRLCRRSAACRHRRSRNEHGLPAKFKIFHWSALPCGRCTGSGENRSRVRVYAE